MGNNEEKIKKYKTGRLRNYKLLKRDFMKSKYQSIAEFFRYQVGMTTGLTGSLRKGTQGRGDEREKLLNDAEKEAKKQTKQELIDKYKPDTLELMKQKSKVINLIALFLDGAVEEIYEEREVKKGKKTVKKLVKIVKVTASMSEIQKAYNILKVELGEPTNISSFDPDSGLKSVEFVFGGGIGPSQFISQET